MITELGATCTQDMYRLCIKCACSFNVCVRVLHVSLGQGDGVALWKKQINFSFVLLSCKGILRGSVFGGKSLAIFITLSAVYVCSKVNIQLHSFFPDYPSCVYSAMENLCSIILYPVSLLFVSSDVNTVKVCRRDASVFKMYTLCSNHVNMLLKSDVTRRDHVVRCRGSQECGSCFVIFIVSFIRDGTVFA